MNKFLSDFPDTENEADVQIKMSTMVRSPQETPQEYFYKMLTCGKKGRLIETAIIRHIVSGINDHGLKGEISKEYATYNTWKPHEFCKVVKINGVDTLACIHSSSERSLIGVVFFN